jgi:hypothetical protein
MRVAVARYVPFQTSQRGCVHPHQLGLSARTRREPLTAAEHRHVGAPQLKSSSLRHTVVQPDASSNRGMTPRADLLAPLSLCRPKIVRSTHRTALWCSRLYMVPWTFGRTALGSVEAPQTHSPIPERTPPLSLYTCSRTCGAPGGSPSAAASLGNNVRNQWPGLILAHSCSRPLVVRQQHGTGPVAKDDLSECWHERDYFDHPDARRFGATDQS